MDTLSFDIDKLIKICRENDAAMVGVFGSVARGEDTLASDIDLLVKFSSRKSLLDIVKLERELSTELGSVGIRIRQGMRCNCDFRSVLKQYCPAS